MKKIATVIGASILLAAGSVSAEELETVTYELGMGANHAGIGVVVNYGTNAILTNSSATSVDKKFEGVNVGVGYISNRNGGWSADLMYIDTSKAKTWADANSGYTLSGGKVKLAFGYRF